MSVEDVLAAVDDDGSTLRALFDILNQVKERVEKMSDVKKAVDPTRYAELNEAGLLGRTLSPNQASNPIEEQTRTGQLREPIEDSMRRGIRVPTIPEAGETYPREVSIPIERMVRRIVLDEFSKVRAEALRVDVKRADPFATAPTPDEPNYANVKPEPPSLDDLRTFPPEEWRIQEKKAPNELAEVVGALRAERYRLVNRVERIDYLLKIVQESSGWSNTILEIMEAIRIAKGK